MFFITPGITRSVSSSENDWVCSHSNCEQYLKVSATTVMWYKNIRTFYWREVRVLPGLLRFVVRIHNWRKHWISFKRLVKIKTEVFSKVQDDGCPEFYLWIPWVQQTFPLPVDTWKQTTYRNNYEQQFFHIWRMRPSHVHQNGWN